MLGLEAFGIEFWSAILFCILFGILWFSLYRSHIFSLVDPLNVFVISQVSASVLAITFIDKQSELVRLLIAQVAFLVGFRINRPRRITVGRFNWSPLEIQATEWVVGILFVVWLLGNAYLTFTAGIPVLAENPSIAKTAVFTTGGLGFVRRLNDGVGVFVPAGALLMSVKGTHRRLFGVLFVMAAALAAMGGAKGALLTSIFIVGYVIRRRDLVSGLLAVKLKRYLILLAVAAVFFSLLMLARTARDSAPLIAIAALFQRILLYGDVIIYYYDPHVMQLFAGLGPLDFIYSLLNPILGALRVVEYQFPLGYQMVDYLSSDVLATVLGPNTPYYITARIYFGPVFGTLYAVLVGFCVSRIRGWFLNSTDLGPLRMSCLLTLAVEIFILPTEAPYFTSVLFDTFVPVALVVLIVSITLYGAGNRSKESRRELAGLPA